MKTISQAFGNNNGSPQRNQVFVIKDFLGKGKQLQSQKRQRRKIQQQHLILSNQVALLTKNNFKTAREIDRQQKHIQYLIDTKKRHKNNQNQKQKLEYEHQSYLQHLNQRFRSMKNTSQRNISHSIRQMMQTNKRHHDETKNMKNNIKTERQFYTKRDLQIKSNNFHTMNKDKHEGLLKVIDFKTAVNQKSLNQYNKQIEQQNNRIFQRAREIQKLQKEKGKTVELLQKRSQISLQLKQLIKSSGSVNLQLFQTSYRNLKNKRRKFRQTSTKILSTSDKFSQIQDPQNVKKSFFLTNKQYSKGKISQTIQLRKRSDIFAIIKNQRQWSMSANKLKKRKRNLRKKRIYDELYLSK